MIWAYLLIAQHMENTRRLIAQAAEKNRELPKRHQDKNLPRTKTESEYLRYIRGKR